MRNRLPKNLPHRRTGREILYDWRAVVKIMDALLRKEPGEHKMPTRGAPRRFWPSDPDCRARVLSGIEARINSIPVPGKIRSRFLTVIHRHLPDSAKK